MLIDNFCAHQIIEIHDRLGGSQPGALGACAEKLEAVEGANKARAKALRAAKKIIVVILRLAGDQQTARVREKIAPLKPKLEIQVAVIALLDADNERCGRLVLLAGLAVQPDRLDGDGIKDSKRAHISLPFKQLAHIENIAGLKRKFLVNQAGIGVEVPLEQQLTNAHKRPLFDRMHHADLGLLDAPLRGALGVLANARANLGRIRPRTPVAERVEIFHRRGRTPRRQARRVTGDLLAAERVAGRLHLGHGIPVGRVKLDQARAVGPNLQRAHRPAGLHRQFGVENPVGERAISRESHLANMRLLAFFDINMNAQRPIIGQQLQLKARRARLQISARVIKLLESIEVVQQLLALQIPALTKKTEGARAKIGEQFIALKLLITVKNNLLDDQTRPGIDIKDQVAVQPVVALLAAAHLGEGIAAGLKELANRALGAPNLFRVDKSRLKKGQLIAQILDRKLEIALELNRPARPLGDVHQHIHAPALDVFSGDPADNSCLKKSQLPIMLHQRIESFLEAIRRKARGGDTETAHENRMPRQQLLLGAGVIKGAKPAKTQLADFKLVALLDTKDKVNQVPTLGNRAHRDIDLGAKESVLLELIFERPQLRGRLGRVFSVRLGLAIDQQLAQVGLKRRALHSLELNAPNQHRAGRTNGERDPKGADFGGHVYLLEKACLPQPALRAANRAQREFHADIKPAELPQLRQAHRISA